MKITKNYSIFLFLFAFVFSFTTYGQSKKKLKQMNAQLTSENQELRRSKDDLEKKSNSLAAMNEQLTYEMESLKSDVSKLQAENSNLKNEIDELESENEGLVTTLENSKSNSGAVANGNNMPANSANCSSKQGALMGNKSYFVDLSSTITVHGWGVQVYSTKSLCDAQGYAENFESYYKMWKTYIKVTEDNGEQIYSVVYGTLKYEDQAKVYMENFKKIGRNEDERNAILVQH
ncbi:SPOR domain-containing protein [Flammeovirga yaeyamensis]|uniref:SPOR domain-containing protein n=2 Tax=Flammeovirga yaeyamensis TaxID=367791 RepID=A0AAX1N7Y4_9BACT|nr:SPOR domain-containing protein [Flammeovirga yaeyamensis]MBB3698960.1 FtsZ-binding cell division protein ZapB [Flammeovirga yaeyamensis]NMF36394.1 hypothetical protein [Flammeovirga yaeyamensis]QWG03645.1 SPOR domain-containing protein [Flammeovirga yaeyamensis]